MLNNRTAKHDRVEVAAETTAQVNAELRAGALEETVTVSGQAPVVDVQSASASRTVMSRAVMDAMPTARNIGGIGILIPGTGLQQGGGGFLAYDVGGTGLLQQSPLSYHGSNETVMAVDGMRMNNRCGSGQSLAMYWSDAMFSEISYAPGADSGEMGQSGLRIIAGSPAISSRPTTCWWRPRTTIRSRFWCRPIHGCRTAARRSPASTT